MKKIINKHQDNFSKYDNNVNYLIYLFQLALVAVCLLRNLGILGVRNYKS